MSVDGLSGDSVSCFSAYVDATLTSVQSKSATHKLPTAIDLDLVYKDRKKLKRLLRMTDWPIDDDVRHCLWLKLCQCVEDCKFTMEGYHEAVQDIFGQGDEQLEMTKLPPFVDTSCLYERHLSATGVNVAKRVLCVIGHERPDVTYSPTLFTLTCLLLHYVDEPLCYGCLRVLIVSKQRYIAQTNISYQARTLVLHELARRHAKPWYQFVTRKGFEVDAILCQWQWWILKDLNFSYLVRVLDCYLFEGPKVLYRIALAILILHYKHNLSVAKHSVNICETSSTLVADIHQFCANLPVSVSKLFKTAFGIRGLSRSLMRKLILKKEIYVQSCQNAAALSAAMPPSQSTGSLTMVVGHSTAGQIISRHAWHEVYKWLPKRFALNEPKLVFSTSVHGTSLNTFYSRVAGHQPTFLAIKTDKAEAFGAYCSADWSERKCQQRNRGYFGTGETFVCTLAPKHVKFSWVGLNLGEQTPHCAQLFQLADVSQITVGGGGGCAITLDENLLRGRSERCETFNNSPLVSSIDGVFVVVLLEVFAFD